MANLAPAHACPCRTDRRRVHADHIQPGDAVWLPNNTWVRYDWSDAAEGNGPVTFAPDGMGEVEVQPDYLLLRKLPT